MNGSLMLIGVVPKDQLGELSGMAAFRNVLVHDYLRLDREKVYYILIENVPLLQKMGQHFSRLL